ncbi:hypothetical protein [Pedobacter psychrodurus]|uniref:hypothetical protein n=1 Tax=Pedobacter psychrodurus TaxID=2530456 RepID=UPI00292DD930|nr:hypothetical protein [Pedobacter psychrodurus]
MLNRYMLAIILFLTTGISSAQIKGTFVYAPGFDGGARTLTFSDLGFTDQSTCHVGVKYGAGSFKIKNDSLYLAYFKLEDKDSSQYKISSEEARYGYTHIYVQSFDGKIPISGSLIALRDQDFNIIFAADAVSEGKASLQVRKQEKISYLTVDFIGYNQVVIPFGRLQGKRSDIFVGFKPQHTLIQPPHIEVYRVIKLEEKKLILQNAAGTELVFAKRGVN